MFDYHYHMSISKNDINNFRLSQIEKELFKGFIRIHILHHASEEKVFGQALKFELERHGYTLSYGTLYPLLHRMERENLLTSERSTVAGKVRKYYRITEEGRSMLAKAKEYIHELVDEVLGEGCL
jgi:DNA-binding PadR family transcriptional regulator